MTKIIKIVIAKAIFQKYLPLKPNIPTKNELFIPQLRSSAQISQITLYYSPFNILYYRS